MKDSNQKTNTFPIWFSVAFSLFLVIPFLLRIVSPELEGYPAIILPSGASTLSLNDQTLVYSVKNLWGKNQTGEWEKIDPVHFLEPIPAHFLFKILDNNFGLSPSEKIIEFRYGIISPIHLSPKGFSENELEATREWISTQLLEAGLSPDQLRITDEVKEINRVSGHLISERITDEKIILLHR